MSVLATFLKLFGRNKKLEMRLLFYYINGGLSWPIKSLSESEATTTSYTLVWNLGHLKLNYVAFNFSGSKVNSSFIKNTMKKQ